MENNSQLFEQIEHFETEGRYAKAQACREKILKAAESAEEKEFVSLCDFLVRETITVRGVDGAVKNEPFYERLHNIVCQRFGSNHMLTALAKQKLVKMAKIQGHYTQAILWLGQVIPVLIALQGTKSGEVSDAKEELIECTGYIDPTKAKGMKKAFEEEQRQLHRLCKHLKRVEDYLLARGIKFLDCGRRCGLNGVVMVQYDAWLDIASLREKLHLDPCVAISEWEDTKAGLNGRGFVCTIHQDSIEGHYHQRKNTPIVS